MDSTSLDLSHLVFETNAELERTLILDAMAEAGAQIVTLRHQFRMAEIEHDRFLGEDFNALADFLAHETLRKAGDAVIFEGEVTLDPTKGRSGHARRQAAHHLRQYQQNKADAERREVR